MGAWSQDLKGASVRGDLESERKQNGTVRIRSRMTGTGERLAGPVDQPKPARRTLVAFLSIESEKMICTTDRDRQEALGCHVPRVGAARVWMAAGQDLRCIG